MARNLIIFILLISHTVFGRNQSEPVYVEPFDRGAGGTVLTRASREGILMGNPALLNLGRAWVRWAGLQFTLKVKGNTEKIKQGMETAQSSEDELNADVLEAIDFGFGPELTIAILNQNGGGTVFLDSNVYFRYDAFGNTGIPGARASLEALGGVAIAGAISPVRWLTLGVTQKNLYGLQKDITVTPVNSADALAELQNTSGYGTASGTDLGALLFIQGFVVDFSLGLTMSNLSPVKFSDEAYPTLVPMKNLGLGLAIHAGSSVIDLSAELHDVEAKSGENLTRRLHLGARFLIWKSLGTAVGYTNNGLSYGLILDLIILKLTLSYSKRVVGFGESSIVRPEATITTSLGF